LEAYIAAFIAAFTAVHRYVDVLALPQIILIKHACMVISKLFQNGAWCNAQVAVVACMHAMGKRAINNMDYAPRG
jgi:hypothetical protein